MMNKKYFVLNLILILTISLSAGFFISTKIYNDQWQDMMLKVEELLENERFNFVDKLEDSKLLTESTAYKLNGQIFLIANKKNQTTGDVLNQAYSSSDFIANAVVVTNDGWLVTNTSINNITNLVIIDNQNEIFQIEEMVHDSILGINYLKINKTGLDPVAIIDSDNLEIGEIVYGIRPNIYNYQHDIMLNSVKNLHTRFIKNKIDLVYQPGDIIYGLLNNQLDGNLPIINDQSQFIGFSVDLNNQSYLLPSKYIRYSLTQLLSGNKKIIYPTLGISHIDLSEVVLNNDLPNEGALVYSILDKDNLFKKGDIIIKVENDGINKARSLNELLLDYKIGNKIKLILIRDQQEIEVEVIIKALE
jgi:PDZ domain